MVTLTEEHKRWFDNELQHLVKLIHELESYKTNTVKDTMRELIRTEIKAVYKLYINN